MRGDSLHPLVLALALTASACALEASDAVDAEIAALASKTGEGIAKIERALDGPALASRELGEGVRAVEDTAAALARLETDARSSDLQRLMAIVQQARAWDDTYRAIVGDSRAHEDMDPAHRALLADLLQEKAFPAQIAAQNSYARALRWACRLGMNDDPVLLELVDGIERHGGRALSVDRACD